MKLVVAIIASKGDYNKFKSEWIRVIKSCKKDKELCDLIDFYFLYTDKNGESSYVESKISKKKIYIDFYDNAEQETVTKSILNRTISFINFVKTIYKLDNNDNYIKAIDSGFYILRTNLSTLFDFKKIIKWIRDKPLTNFFAGSINGVFLGFNTHLSGTNLLFSLDIALYLHYYTHLINTEIPEDDSISEAIIKKIKIQLINIKRLDFVEMEKVEIKGSNITFPATPNSVIYHKTIKYDDDIFCFRFKTFNRENDVRTMSSLIDKLKYKDFNLTKFVIDYSKQYNPPLPIIEQSPDYGKIFSERIFTIEKQNK